MNTNINLNQLKTFITKDLRIDKLDEKIERKLIEINNRVTERLDQSLDKTNNVEAAAVVGTTIAKKAIEKGITTVVFDRGGFIYQGKVQALANAAREAGLEF